MKRSYHLGIRVVQRVSFIFCLMVLVNLWGTPAFAARAESPAFVRVIHASPFVGAADVFVDGSRLLSSFLFGSVTDYAAIPPGPHKVQIALVGKGIGASVISETLAVSPGLAYTVAAIGTSPATLSLEVFQDNNRIAAGTAKVRIYDLAPDAGKVMVSAGTRTLLNGMDYREASDYFAVPVGAYTFTVKAPGANMALPFSTKLKANSVTSVFAVGLLNGSPKIEIVPMQVSGTPGLPGTGSDPNPTGITASSLLPWLFGALLLLTLALGSSFITRRLAYEV